MPSTMLLQALLIPIVASPVAYYLGRSYGSKSAAWFTFAVLLYSTLALLAAFLSGNPAYENYPWFPTQLTGSSLLSSAGSFGLYLDGISAPFAITIYVICTAVALFSVPYMRHRILEQETVASEATGTASSSINIQAGSEIPYGRSASADIRTAYQDLGAATRVNSRFGLYFSFYLLYSAGMLGTVLATNLIELYFLFELMLIPSYFLIAEFGYGARGRISFMYLLWTNIGALIMLLAFLAIGSQTGSFVFIGNGAMDAARIAASILPWIVFGIIVGLFVKLAAFGFHIWLPYAHGEAPTPISALLSPAMIGIAGYIVIRLFTQLLPNALVQIGLGLALWGVITMFYGGIMALAQDDIKRLLAYSSISQMGYLIFGIGTATSLGMGGAVFQFITHGLAKSVLFMAAGIIIVQAGGLRSIKRMGGLSTKLPITATCAMIAFLALLGFPETVGFQSEWLIFGGGLELGAKLGSTAGDSWLALSILGLISTLITASYSMWTMKRVFFGKLPEELSNVREPSWYMLGPLILMSALAILLGVLPSIVDNSLFHTLQNLPNLLR